LIQAGDYEEATKIFNQLTPARTAFQNSRSPGGGLINRMMWKYQGWLQGYNGGPIRHPTGRVYARDMIALRRGQEAAGLSPTSDPDEAFFIGRNPA
jgi:4-hydroxy-tetrahydrodipicolinate synthase